MTDAAYAPDAAPAPAPDNTGTPAQNPAPSAAPANEDWRAVHLPEDLRADPSFKDIKDVASLAKSYKHAQQLVGLDRSKLVPVPGEDATEEAWNDFYKRIGRPDTPEDYRLPVEEVQFDDVLRRNEDAEKWLKQAAHRYGMTPKQTAGLYKDFMEFTRGTLQQNNARLEQMREQTTAALEEELGAAYETKLDQAKAVLRNNFDEEFYQLLDQTGLGSHPSMIRGMMKLAERLQEDRVDDRTQGGGGIPTPAEAQAQIQQKMGDKDFMAAYIKGDHPSHAWAVAEMTKLHRLAGGQR